LIGACSQCTANVGTLSRSLNGQSVQQPHGACRWGRGTAWKIDGGSV